MKVIITGGSRGIGAACVKSFTARGDDVVFIYKSADDAAQRLCSETGATCIKADVSDFTEAENAIKEAVLKLGTVDVLVNNAGVSHIGLLTDMSNDKIKDIISTDLCSVIVCTKAVIPEMLKKHNGYIINISSIWGITGASCEAVYSAAKAGIIGFTKAMAKELGPSNITVNCVAPGVIDTDMNLSLDSETKASLCEETPLCRIGKCEEVAEAVMFLASNKAGFVTGEVLNVNGGFVI